MTLVLVFVLAGCLVALGSVLACSAWLVLRPWRGVVRRRVMLVLGDVTIEGILWARRGPLLVLRDARVFLSAGNPATPVDGEMVVERDRIQWVQVLP